RATDLAAFDNQDVPFERVVSALSGRGAGHDGDGSGARAAAMAAHPQFQVMVVYLAGDGAAAGGGIGAPRPVDTGSAKFDLSFDFAEDPATGTLGGVVEFSSDLFDRSTAEQLARGIECVLRAMAASPGARVGALDMLDSAGRRRVLEEWNRVPGRGAALDGGDGSADSATGDSATGGVVTGRAGAAATVPDLFTAAAARSADARALVGHGPGGADEYTFAQLAA